MRVCIVSPHLDDAVLSCGIAMQRMARAGDDVLVLNIFNAGTNADARRAEEGKAADVLNAAPFFLDELDAPDRDARYTSEIELFHGDFSAVPEETVARVTRRVGEFIAREKIDAAFFPLAAGTHIDHRIAFAAGQRLNFPRTRYYEDRPYILWPGMLQARLNGIACKTNVKSVSKDDMQAALGDYHYLRHFVPAGAFRDACLPRYFSALAPPAAWRFAGEVEEMRATPEECEKIYDSLACYASQMPYIYPNRATFMQDSLRHEKARSMQDAYIERSWTLTPL